MVSKNTIVPTSADHEVVELNIVLDNVLVVLHLQVIDTIFSIGSGIYGSKFNVEIPHKSGPVIHPVGYFVRVEECRLKIFQGCSPEIRQSKVDLSGIVRIGRAAAEIKVAQKDEVIKLLWIRTIERVGFLGLCLVGRILASAELLCHQHNGFSECCCGFCFKR